MFWDYDLFFVAPKKIPNLGFHKFFEKCKVHIFLEGHKILRNLHLTFDWYYIGQKLTGIYILQKIRNYANLKIQNGKTLPKLNIGIYSKFGQYYRYDITMYDFIHIIQFLIPIWSWISKMMLENETFFHFSFEMLLRLHSYLNLL